jgi:formyl-CoA transferase
MALHHRNANGGKGQVVDVALYEAVFNMMEGALPEYDLFGEIRERTGSNLTGIVPSNTYLTRDGQHVVIGANADSIFRRLMKAIGREDLAEDESLADNAGRAKRAEELDRAIGAWTAKLDAGDVVRTLNQIQVPGGKIYSMADITRDAQYLARDMIRQVRLKDGTPLKVPGIVPKLSATPGDIEWIGAELGEHTESVLAAHGYTGEEIARLRESRAI